MLRFTIPGRPVTWQRPNEVRGHRVTDAAQRAEKRRIAAIAKRALPKGWPTDAEYAVEVVGYWPDRRYGDMDRLVSLTMDALQGVAYLTDRQVAAQGSARVLDRERPRVEVTVAALGEAERASVSIEVTR